MKLTSYRFKDGDYLRPEHVLSAAYGFGCSGGNQSPHLRWEGAPAGDHPHRYLFTVFAVSMDTLPVTACPSRPIPRRRSSAST